MKLIYEIVLPKFPTHVKLSEKRRAQYKLIEGGVKVLKNPLVVGTPKFWKINGQAIYSGNLHPHSRSSAMNFMHNFIKEHLKKLNLKPITQFPITIRGEMHTVRHHGNVKMRRGILELNCPKKYIPNWDIGNQNLWNKAFDDCLFDPEIKLIPDDNVDLVEETGGMKRVYIDRFEDRKLVFKIYTYEDEERLSKTKDFLNKAN